MNYNMKQSLMVYSPQAFFKLISNKGQHPRVTLRSILIDDVGYKPTDVINCVGDPWDCGFWLFRPKTQIALKDRTSDWEMFSPLVPASWAPAVEAIKPLLWPPNTECPQVKMWGPNIYCRIHSEEFLIVSDQTQPDLEKLLFLILLKMVSHLKPDHYESPFEVQRLRDFEKILCESRKDVKTSSATHVKA